MVGYMWFSVDSLIEGNETMMNDYVLDKIAADYAAEIASEMAGGNYTNGDLGVEQDLAFQYADGSEHVTYHHKAHAICQNCNIDSGEDMIREMGEPNEGWTYNSMATAIAFWELNTRILVALQDMED